MFYVKSVFTICPGCGIEHMVDLGEILSSGDADLCSTQVYCHKCSKKRAQQHRGAEWAEQLVRE